MTETIQLDPAKTALLMIQQNEFTTEGSVLHDAVSAVMDKTEGDIVVEGKRGLDTFASTNLDFIG